MRHLITFFPDDIRTAAIDMDGRIVARACLPAPPAGVNFDRACRAGGRTLTVGVLCLTPRFSGRAVANLIERSGAALTYLHPFAAARALPPVDVLVIAGGIDSAPSDRLVRDLAMLSPAECPATKVLLCGPRAAREHLSGAWPPIEWMPPPLNDSLYPSDDTLLYRLQALMAAPPAAPGELGLDTVLAMALTARLAEPVHAEGTTMAVLSIDGPRTSYVRTHQPAVAFEGIGTGAAATATRLALAGHTLAFDVVQAVDPDNAEATYLALVEGRCDTLLLHHAALFLALDHAGKVGDAPRHLLVTGQGAGFLDPIIAMRLAQLAEFPAEIELDRQDVLWILGLASIPPSIPVSHQMDDMSKPGHEQISAAVLTYLSEKKGQDIGLDQNLFDTDMVDSLDVLELIAFIESTYGIEVRQDLLTRENFETVAKVTETVLAHF